MEKAKARIIAASTAGDLVCAAAGRISTTEGTALEILTRSAEKENNGRLIEKVVASGHHSLVEHAFFSIAFDSVSVCTEEFVIEHRLASFTVQSRRYVDFSHIGCYEPPLPAALAERYRAHMREMVSRYARLLELGIPKEDARFVLPYSFRSNFYCTLNARELMHMIAAMLWGRGSVFPELKTLGESLKTQFEEYFPNLLNEMQKRYRADEKRYALPVQPSAIPDPVPAKAKTVLLEATEAPDLNILDAASVNFTIGRDTEPSLRDIVYGERPRELEMVGARFVIRDLSLAAVTHLVRHRMQSVLIPQITRAVLTGHYLIPPSLAENEKALALYRESYAMHTAALRAFLAAGLPTEAVQYFALAGNQLDVCCYMNGRQLEHFFALRTCSRAQWEIRACAVDLLKALRKKSPALYQLMGPSCYVTGVCPEGRLSCGKAKEMQQIFAEVTTMEEVKAEKCPHCGAAENIVGIQDDRARISAQVGVFMKNQPLYHIICLRCGTIIRSYIENPEKFINNKTGM